MNKNISCCFTGHRLEKLPWRGNENATGCITLKEKISAAVEAAYRSGIRHFICGMATGCDMYFCESVIALRSEHDEVTLEAAVPWEGQASSWTNALKQRHSRLVEDCDYLTLVQTDFTPDCLMKRNHYMVDSASMIIVAYSGMPGGTMSTLLYAMRQGLEIIEIGIE